MKKWFFTTLACCVGFGLCLGQKHQLDSADITDWPSIDGGTISNTGAYVGYTITHQNNWDAPKEFILWSAKTGQENVYKNGVGHPVFTRDDQFCILSDDAHQSLIVRDLVHATEVVLEKAEGFKLVGEKIVYQKEGALEVYDPKGKTSFSLAGVESYQNFDGGLVVVKKNEVELLDAANPQPKTIWTGSGPVKGLEVQDANHQLAFVSDGDIWWYKSGMSDKAKKAEVPASDKLKGWTFDGLGGFSPHGGLLLLRYAGPSDFDSTLSRNTVKIFDYRDRGFDLGEQWQRPHYKVLYNLNNQSLTFPEDDEWGIVKFDPTECISCNDDYVVMNSKYGGSEGYWNKDQESKMSIYRIADGKRIAILHRSFFGFFSATAKYFVFVQDGDLFSLSLASGDIKNLSDKLPIPARDNVDESLQDSKSRGFSTVPVWLNGGDQFLIRDQYDYWLMDASGNKAAVNVSNGYGRANKIVLNNPAGDITTMNAKPGDNILFSYYNTATKQSGMCQVRLGVQEDPKILCTDSLMIGDGSPRDGGRIFKAAQRNVWLVQKQSGSVSANLFLSTDFKKFTPVSHNYPERQFDWFDTKVVDYVTKDGVRSQAILLQPKHLEPGRKYPVLFNWYEHETDGVASVFHLPDYTSSYYFNYARMLTRGYLVCVPDIHFTLGKTAHSIVDCVEGAADAISGLPYVDGANLGASGGSFGGYGVNCVAALSHRFKAIVSISGLADMLNAYSNIPGLRDEEVENRQCRMGVSLGTDPESYLANSPIKYVRTMTTPLLIIDNPRDVNVNPQQGYDLFINLRREGKPAWMLWYPDESHGVSGKNNQIDLGNRMDQFFDYYLKGGPLPVWMSKGLPIWYRSSGKGFEVDQNAAKPGPGLNSDEDIQRANDHLKAIK